MRAIPDQTQSTVAARPVARRRWALLGGLALLMAALDQVSKALVVNGLAIGQSWAPIPALANIFQITRSANSGAAFGTFQGANLPLMLLSLAMIVGIVIFFRQLAPGHTGQTIALGFLLGGVIGNALDRMRFGTVVDFIHWQLPGVISNVSNLADHAIVFSVLTLLIIGSRTNRTSEHSHGSATKP